MNATSKQRLSDSTPADVRAMFSPMPDDPPRPAKREDALFAIRFGLRGRSGQELAREIAATEILAAIEGQNMYVAQKPPLPSHSSSFGGTGERKWRD